MVKFGQSSIDFSHVPGVKQPLGQLHIGQRLVIHYATTALSMRNVWMDKTPKSGAQSMEVADLLAAVNDALNKPSPITAFLLFGSLAID